MSLKKLVDLDLLSRAVTKIKALIPSAATASPKMDGTAAVGTSAKYAREDHKHPTDTSRAASVHTHSTQDLIRPSALRWLNDNTLQTLISTTRANRLAFLPADQIIIEKTTDGGVTWVDAGVSDANKIALFSETRPNIGLPLLNGARSLLCGLRITITAMKYNVPSGTSETDKYNYWTETYVKSTERYCQLKELYFWLNSVNDTIGVKVERATGKAPNNWISIFDDSTFYMSGSSGCGYLRFGQGRFGGHTSQTTNYWNYRITLMTKGVNGTDTVATTGNTTSSQTIMEIRGYGDTVWTVANQFMANDHLYSKDASQNATFPANVTASKFIGNLQGNADSATNASKVNNHTVNSDVPANAVFTDTTYESKAAASGGTDVSLVTTGEKYTWNSKQAALVSGTNIKTINGSSLLGSGDLAVSSLPAVTSSDNDKVLKVVSGAWAAAENDGGTMTISISGHPPNTTISKTFSEAHTAYQNGSMLFANWNGNFYRLSGVSSTSLSFTKISVNDDTSVGSSTLTYSSSGAISLSSATVVKSTPFIIPLLCDDSSDYMDPPSGTLSIEYGNDISDITYESTKREVILVNGYDSYDLYGTYSCDKYRIVSTVFTPGASGDPDTLTIIFRCLGSRNGTSIIKTITLSGEVYSGVIAVSYSEEPTGSGSMPVNAAVIHVNAPLGSAITFFKDSTVMEAVTAAQTHPNADGKTEDYYYSVPTSDFGSWTVAASKSGENDATQSFSVLVAKQYDAILSYLAPYDFQAIEWLQTSAAYCYFDTGIDITTNTIQTEVYCETVGYPADYDLTLFGTALGYAVTANGYRERWSFCYSTGGDIAWDTILTYTYTEGTDYHLVYNALGGSVILDDVNVAGSRNRRPQNTSYPRLYIGRYYNPSNGNYYYGRWRYKRFTVSDTSTGEILADFQPCYRKADHVIGFWDSVSKAFFVNLGTGTLTAGPDI